jgi:hypothetical protein
LIGHKLPYILMPLIGRLKLGTPRRLATIRYEPPLDISDFDGPVHRLSGVLYFDLIWNVLLRGWHAGLPSAQGANSRIRTSSARRRSFFTSRKDVLTMRVPQMGRRVGGAPSPRAARKSRAGSPRLMLPLTPETVEASYVSPHEPLVPYQANPRKAAAELIQLRNASDVGPASPRRSRDPLVKGNAVPWRRSRCSR